MASQQLLLGGGKPVKTYVDDLFKTHLYKGTNSSTTVNVGLDMAKGGLVWVKSRGTTTANHNLWDTERGADKRLRTNGSNAENTGASQAFTSTGFTLAGTATDNNDVNVHYVSHNFRKVKHFFEIVKFTGNGTSGRQIAHGLGSVPGMIIIKNRDTSDQWIVGHGDITATNPWNSFIQLNSTAGSVADTRFANTAPTATHFTVGGSDAENKNGSNLVAYLFGNGQAAFGENGDQVAIKTGSYSGIGGRKVIDLGFEAGYVMVKQVSEGGHSWYCADQTRGMHWIRDTNLGDSENLRWENSGSVINNGYIIANNAGFEISGHPEVGKNGARYIFLAIALPTGKNGRPPETGADLFAMDVASGSSTPPTFDSTFFVSAAFHKQHQGGDNWRGWGRNMNGYYHTLNTNSSMNHASNFVWDSNTGWGKNQGSNDMSWMFKKGVSFDICSYVGTGSGQGPTRPHSLGKAPHMMWFKRSDSADWICGHHWAGWGWATELSGTDRFDISAQTGYFVNGATAYRGIGMSDNRMNQFEKSYTAWLFASVDGISKAGAWSGTGSQFTVDFGFQPRFIIVRGSNATACNNNGGNWDVYDSYRGFNAIGSTSYRISLNTSSGQTGVSDHLGVTSSGITVGTNGRHNTNGGYYVYWAHA